MNIDRLGLCLIVSHSKLEKSMSSPEPSLRVQKLDLKYGNEGGVQKSISNDLQCLSAAQDFLAVGLASGRVLVYRGQPKQLFYDMIPPFKLRTCAVSFNNAGDLLLAATVNSGGRALCLINMRDGKTRDIPHDCQVHSCAIDPNLNANSSLLSCVFCDANGTVWRMKPKGGMFSSSGTEKVKLAEKTGADVITWKGDVIAWGYSERGSFTLYNAAKNDKIFKSDSSISQRMEHPRCSFDVRGDRVRVSVAGVIFDVPVHGAKGHKLQPIADKPTFLVASVGNISARLIEPQKGKAVIEIQQGSSIFSSAIDVKPDYAKKQMALQGVSSINGFYLILDGNAYLITIASSTDKIDYYLNTGNMDLCLVKFNEAKDTLAPNERCSLTIKILTHLINGGDTGMIKEMCEYTNDADWPEIIGQFGDTGRLDIIVPYIPLDRVNLSRETVTDILMKLMDHHEDRFCEMVGKLEKDCFLANRLLGDVERRAEKDDRFSEPLVKLFLAIGQPDKALKRALTSEHYSGFFDDIANYEQYGFILDKRNISQIMNKFHSDTDATFHNFLMGHIDQLPPEKILQLVHEMDIDAQRRLETDPEKTKDEIEVIESFEYKYLSSLRERHHDILRDPKWGTQLALMCIKYNDPKTMDFLKGTASYDVMKVSRIAKEKHRFREAAYLCQRAGNPTDGMSMMLEVGDPREAIQYARDCDNERSHKDEAMWQMLKQHSFRNAEFLREMLRELPSLKMDPVKFIKDIPNVHIIPDFEDLANVTIKEYMRKCKTAELAQQIVSSDAFGVLKRSFDQYKVGKYTNF